MAIFNTESDYLNPLLIGMGGDGIDMATLPGANPQFRNAYQQMGPLRAAENLNRQNSVGAPRPRAASRSRGGGNPGADPGYVDPSIFADPQVRQAANEHLAPYGLQLPENAREFGILPEGGFFSNHPTLGRALDSGLFGAMATNGGATIGENIQNVIHGVLAGRNMQAQAQAAPFTSVMNQAAQMEQLRDMGDKHALNQAMINWHNAQANKANQTPPEKYSHWQVDANGRMHGFTSQGNDDLIGNSTYNIGANKPVTGKIPMSLIPYFNKNGIDPTTATPDEWNMVHGQFMHDQLNLRAAGPNAAYNSGNRLTDSQKVQIQNVQHQMLDGKNEATRKGILNQLIISGKYDPKIGLDEQVESTIRDHNQDYLNQINDIIEPDQQPQAAPMPARSKGKKSAAPAQSPQPTASAPPQGKMSFGDFAKHVITQGAINGASAQQTRGNFADTPQPQAVANPNVSLETGRPIPTPGQRLGNAYVNNEQNLQQKLGNWMNQTFVQSPSDAYDEVKAKLTGSL